MAARTPWALPLTTVAGLALVLPLLVTVSPGSAASRAVPLSDCVSSDNGNPVLLHASVSPSVVDVRTRPARVVIRVEVADSGGPGPAVGVQSVKATLHGGLTVALSPWTETTWGQRVTIPRGIAPTEAGGLSSVELRDGARNFSRYAQTWLAASDMPVGLSIRSVRDDRRPVLRDLWLSTTSVDTRHGPAAIQVSARVTDDRAGTKRVTLLVDHPPPWHAGSYRTTLRRVSGSARDGRWRGTLHMPRWQGDFSGGVFVETVDKVGNGRGMIWSSKELRQRGFPSSLTVRSRSDRVKPLLPEALVSPATVDVRETAANVRFTVHASDAKSGVAHVSVWLLHLGRGLDLRLESGSRRDGVWTGRLPVSRCTVAGTYSVNVSAVDRATMARSTPTGPLVYTVVNVDREPPEIETTSDAPPAGGPVTVVFSEDVAGISQESAPVSTLQPPSSDPYVPAPAISGTWSCRSESGTETTCATGAVRTASWTPDQPLQPGTAYVITFNPEHVLDVTDLNGNPLSAAAAFTPAA